MIESASPVILVSKSMKLVSSVGKSDHETLFDEGRYRNLHLAQRVIVKQSKGRAHMW